MKRLLEWKQRMLQSPLTRKGGGGGGSGGGSGARSSERSTPTQMLVSAGSERDASSPMQRQLQLQPHHVSSSAAAAIPSPVLPVQQPQHSSKFHFEKKKKIIFSLSSFSLGFSAPVFSAWDFSFHTPTLLCSFCIFVSVEAGVLT